MAVKKVTATEERCGECQANLYKGTADDSTCICPCNHTTPICFRCCGHSKCGECGKCFDRRANIFNEEWRARTEGKLCTCVRCGSCLGVTPRVRPCVCCTEHYGWTGITDRLHRKCNHCCQHRCCSGVVEQIGRPIVFWTPTARLAKTEFPYESLTPTQSELVLGGLIGSGKLNLHKFGKNKSRRYCSVEIEVSRTAGNGSHINSVCEQWSASIVHDGSINNHGPGGYEINTSPACGDAFTQQLHDITSALERGKSSVNETCGLHVHVDARDYVYQDIQRFIRVYCEIERTLFAATTPDRAKSRFCVPCADMYRQQLEGIKPDTKSLKEAIVETTYGRGSFRAPNGIRVPNGVPTFYTHRNQHRGAGEGTARYWAMNIHTWFRQGTFESRMHHGTIDFDEIFGWARLHVNLVDAVLKNSDAELNEKIGRTDDRAKRQLCQLIGCNVPQSTTSRLGRTVNGLVLLTKLVDDADVVYLAEEIGKQRRNSRGGDE